VAALFADAESEKLVAGVGLRVSVAIVCCDPDAGGNGPDE
jgi:hypothetical protein